MQTPQQKVVEGILKQRELKDKLSQLNNALASQNDEIMQQRIDGRMALQQQLLKYDQETRRLQELEDKKTGLSSQVETASQQLTLHNAALAKDVSELHNLGTFTFVDEKSGISITKTTELRSGGITLGSVSKALVSAGLCGSPEEATGIIKRHNMVSTPILKIRDTITGSTLDIERELPQNTKRKKC